MACLEKLYLGSVKKKNSSGLRAGLNMTKWKALVTMDWLRMVKRGWDTSKQAVPTAFEKKMHTVWLLMINKNIHWLNVIKS